MLAYVFWHSPTTAIDLPTYEDRLIAFHKTLAAHAPPGFISSQIFRTQNLPWLSPGGPAYEDWYLLENSAALDAINDAAITGPRKAPHDSVASLAAAGAAGLYRLKAGALDSTLSARHATWFSKPAITYDLFFQKLRPITAAPYTTFWLRQMVLGAAPEFCIRSAAKPELPAGIAAIHCPVEGIYGH